MERRRLLDLPSEYTRLNYIESTGTQYIDTGVYYNVDDFIINAKIRVRERPTGNYPYLCGYEHVISGNSRVSFAGFNFNVTPPALSFCNTYTDGSAHGMNLLITIGQMYELIWTMKNGSCSVLANGQAVASPVNYTFYRVTQKPFPIFAPYSPYDGGYKYLTYDSKVEVYEWGMTLGGVLVRHFVPALRNADGVVGMYDLCGTICPLTGTPFYINAGSGTFIGG